MQARWVPLVLAWVLGAAGIAHADTVTLYDVSFSDPPHRLGQTVATGLGSATPSRVVFDNPIVQDEIGNLALEFRRDGTDLDLLEQIQFDLGVGASFYTLDFDINVVDLFDPSDSFAVFFDTPVIQRFDFTPSGQLSALQPRPDGGAFTGNFGFQPEGVFAHFRFEVDLDSGQIDIFQNGNLIFDQAFFAFSPDIRTIRLSFSSDNEVSRVVVDNILITARVPEPAALGLLALGCAALALARALRRRPAST
jgi:hypothetical protein